MGLFSFGTGWLWLKRVGILKNLFRNTACIIIPSVNKKEIYCCLHFMVPPQNGTYNTSRQKQNTLPLMHAMGRMRQVGPGCSKHHCRQRAVPMVKLNEVSFQSAPLPPTTSLLLMEQAPNKLCLTHSAHPMVPKRVSIRPFLANQYLLFNWWENPDKPFGAPESTKLKEQKNTFLWEAGVLNKTILRGNQVRARLAPELPGNMSED